MDNFWLNRKSESEIQLQLEADFKKRQEELEIQLYEEYDKKLKEMKEFMVDKLDQYLSLLAKNYECERDAITKGLSSAEIIEEALKCT